eukprot:gene8439-10224_t
MASLSDMVRRRYPEKAQDFDQLRGCQMAAVKTGFLAFFGTGLAVFLCGRAYARQIDPSFHRYVVVSSIGQEAPSSHL